ncbi:SDR family oxidoreductase [Halobacterium jilantaiense]|uniref:3-oxoacyl-[acyl-carrier protein] reductase n=1 Tax=Halobacterium jilantaiense TaxID=355548 RepID=A0A1I0PZD1_9EURY|nr:SDR family oxidoreductase [Halobacterium jilantaiense]SEW19824.1 3-oxoacyl-[acyl-carrier protein] reductase [Halobacterium jilantaiense]
MDLALDGDAALVTASSSGLGKASAAALAREGADVMLCSRSEDRLDAAAEDVRSDAAGDVLTVPTDITDPDDVEAVVDATVDEFGRLDHVVTSAGGVPSGPFLDTSDRDWYDAYDLLVMSVVRTLDAAHEHLVDGGGTVTCVTSTSVSEPLEGLVLSNAVRRGVVGLAKTVAREWAPEVRANVVQPGAHETPRIEELVDASVARGEYDSYEEGLAAWSDDIPLGRVGDPAEFGDVVAFLASDRASFVNGVSLPVDGGRLRG